MHATVTTVTFPIIPLRSGTAPMINKASRRALRRNPVSIRAGYSQPGLRSGVCEVVDLTPAGCLLSRVMLGPLGSEVSLYFRLGRNRHKIDLHGRVAHVTESVGTGVEFTFVGSRQRELLREFTEEAGGEVANPSVPDTGSLAEPAE
jgi:hypothetical protein